MTEEHPLKVMALILDNQAAILEGIHSLLYANIGPMDMYAREERIEITKEYAARLRASIVGET